MWFKYGCHFEELPINEEKQKLEFLKTNKIEFWITANIFLPKLLGKFLVEAKLGKFLVEAKLVTKSD